MRPCPPPIPPQVLDVVVSGMWCEAVSPPIPSQVLDVVVSGMWCEAVFPLICEEWPLAYEGLLRPVLRTCSDHLIAGPALYPPVPGEAGVTGGGVRGLREGRGEAGVGGWVGEGLVCGAG